MSSDIPPLFLFFPSEMLQDIRSFLGIFPQLLLLVLLQLLVTPCNHILDANEQHSSPTNKECAIRVAGRETSFSPCRTSCRSSSPASWLLLPCPGATWVLQLLLLLLLAGACLAAGAAVLAVEANLAALWLATKSR